MNKTFLYPADNATYLIWKIFILDAHPDTSPNGLHKLGKCANQIVQSQHTGDNFMLTPVLFCLLH